MEFFATRNNGLPESLGIDTTTPYTIAWTPGDGVYMLSAVAVDNLDAQSTSPRVAVTISGAHSGFLVINEINYNSPADPASDAGDWIEFYNGGDTTIDLTGWTVRDAKNTNLPYRFPDGATIEANGYLVVARDLLSFREVHQNVAALGPLPFGLGRQDSVRLYDPTGGVVDMIAYGSTAPWPSAANGGGYTLSLIDSALDNSFPQNWIGNPPDADLLGTPGADNDKSDLVPAEPIVTIDQPLGGTMVKNGDSVSVTVSVLTPSLPLANVVLYVDNDPNDSLPPQVVGVTMAAPGSPSSLFPQTTSFDFTWIPSAAGEYHFTAEASETNGRKTRSDLVSVSVSEREISGFEAFAANTIPTGLPAGFDGDADNDGESNGAEYARGTNPISPDNQSNRTLRLSEINDSVIIRFGTTNVSDVSWVLLRSQAFGEWEEIFHLENGTETSAEGVSVTRDPDDASILIITDSDPHDPRGFYMLETKLRQ